MDRQVTLGSAGGQSSFAGLIEALLSCVCRRVPEPSRIFMSCLLTGWRMHCLLRPRLASRALPRCLGFLESLLFLYFLLPASSRHVPSISASELGQFLIFTRALE